MASSDKEAKRRRGLIYLTLMGAASVGAVSVLIALQPFGGPLNWAIRAAALLGYWALFLSVISTAYMRELFKLLGRPFIRVHHILSISALTLVTLHPLGVLSRTPRLAVLVPDFSSVGGFFRLGGRPAWYLIGLAALAALLRTRYKKRWRIVHFLVYMAFLLATIHGVMIGTDLSAPALTVVAVLLALAVVAVFVRKRIQRWQLTRRK